LGQGSRGICLRGSKTSMDIEGGEGGFFDICSGQKGKAWRGKKKKN